MSARPPGSTARRAVPPPWYKGSIASLMGDRRGPHSQRRMRPPAPPEQHLFLGAPRCPTTPHHPWPRGSHFGEPEPPVGGAGGGLQGLQWVPGTQRGTGVHPNLLPWERQRLGGGGKRWLQQPRDADKGEGEGSPAAAGAAVGCSQHPPSMPAARAPSAAPKDAGGSANTAPISRQSLAPLPSSSPMDPWKPHPHRLPGHRHWGDPS